VKDLGWTGSTHKIEEIIWQSVNSTVRVSIRQGDRYTLYMIELLTNRKKQIRHGNQVSNKTINVMAESKQHCEGV
jgi:23S rRNA-/tRNA-specific pseudouridylate synthase